MLLDDYQTIEDYFNNLKIENNIPFPRGEDYVARYKDLSNLLYTKIHPFVEKGATIIDGGCLNNHGKEHIKSVISWASKLIRNMKSYDRYPNLSAYEIYILLMVIHIHDVGNILGRNGHELNASKVVSEEGIDKRHDRIEWECIFDIAESHGGKEKDKISKLINDPILGFPVRRQLLAAILKLSDELSDDRSRASEILLKLKTLPPEAEIYHKYSYALHTVRFDNDTKNIFLYFDLEEKDTTQIFKKSDKKGLLQDAYIIDEIYARTLKTYFECIYCMKYLRPYIEINEIRVLITITLNPKNEKTNKRTIKYDLNDNGYPEYCENDFFKKCPHLVSYTGKLIKSLIEDNKLENVNP